MGALSDCALNFLYFSAIIPSNTAADLQNVVCIVFVHLCLSDSYSGLCLACRRWYTVQGVSQSFQLHVHTEVVSVRSIVICDYSQMFYVADATVATAVRILLHRSHDVRGPIN